MTTTPDNRVTRNPRSKVKTGCKTCRIRKVKCDENKPYCRKCVSTGRTCDGYESLFRFTDSHHFTGNNQAGILGSSTCTRLSHTLTEIDARDVALLNRCFSTKTVFDVELGCNEEAKQVIYASSTSLPIRHAVSSLRVLRGYFEACGIPVSIARQTADYDYGLQQYCTALRALASTLLSPSPHQLGPALLCCQIFISIEQVRGNYAAMAQHIIQGLRIMYQNRARPSLSADIQLIPASQDGLPLLDVFVIKLFAAPCKFAEPPTQARTSEIMESLSTNAQDQEPIGSCRHREIAPDRRKELSKIAMATLEFLDKVAHVESMEAALRLRSGKECMLGALETWLLGLELVQADIGPAGTEPLSVSFMRLFHRILKVILLGALESIPHLDRMLQAETDALRGIASDVGERVKAYAL